MNWVCVVPETALTSAGSLCPTMPGTPPRLYVWRHLVAADSRVIDGVHRDRPALRKYGRAALLAGSAGSDGRRPVVHRGRRALRRRRGADLPQGRHRRGGVGCPALDTRTWCTGLPRSGHRSGAAPEAIARPELARGRLGADVVGRVRPRGGISRRRATSTILCPAHRIDHVIALGERHRIALLRGVAVAAPRSRRCGPTDRSRCSPTATTAAFPNDRARARVRWTRGGAHGGLGPPEGVASCRVTPGVSSVRVCKTVGVSRQPSLEEHLGRCFSQRESARVIRIRRRERRM